MEELAAKALIFDLDGTIWDSRPWYAYLAGRRRNRGAILARFEKGASVAVVLREAGLGPGAFPAACREEIRELDLYPGVRPALDRLAAQAPLGIVTNLPYWIVGPMLAGAGIDQYFNPIVDYTATRRHKPNPEPMYAALAGMNLRPGGTTAWYVGDTPNDCLAAKAAGLSFAWARYGYGSEPANADSVLRKFADTLDL